MLQKPLKHRQQDLDWLIQSPPLLKTDINLSLKNVTVDQDCPQPQSYRLGRYFEDLLEYGLKQQADLELLLSHVQIYQDKQTVGEYDFIYRQNQKVFHLEAAVKFYLGRHDKGTLTDAQNWYGAKGQDRLILKVNKLWQKQLKQSQTDIGRKTLQDHGINCDHIGVRNFVKGCLFYPYNDYQLGNFVFPEMIDSEHLKGWWMYKVQFFEVFSSKTTMFYPLQKLDWLGGGQIQYTHLEMKEMIDALSQPMQIIVCRQGLQPSRGFILP